MKKSKSLDQGQSLAEALARLQSALVVAQSEKNSQEILSLEKMINYFEKKLNLLKSLK